MKDRFKEVFDVVEASEARVENTKYVVLASMRVHQARSFHKSWRIMAVVVMACLLFVSTSVLLYFTPTAVVSVDINPSLEMEINRFDRVVEVNGYNDDGIALANTLKISHMSYSAAMDALMASDTVTDLMRTQDGDLTIAVVPTKNSEQGNEILAYVNQCTAKHQNAHCYTMKNGAHHQAHALGLSCGRYQAYERFKQADVEMTPEQLNAMSMKEIRERMATYGINDVQFENGDGAQEDGRYQKCGHRHRHGH